jgi:two-component system, NarL family, response regulator DevR
MGRKNHTQRTWLATMRQDIGGGRSHSMSSPIVRVLLVDHHELVRDALVVRLDREPDLVVVDAVGTAEQALEVHDPARHDLVVTEHLLPGASGLALVQALRARHPELRAVMLTSSEDRSLVVEAVRAGIAGVVRKRWATSVLVSAVRSVADGACVLDREALAVLAADRHDERTVRSDAAERLSPREVEVLVCLAEGMTNAEVGRRLYVSRETVKTHVAHLLRKLGVEDRASAALKAARLGLIASPSDPRAMEAGPGHGLLASAETY